MHRSGLVIAAILASLSAAAQRHAADSADSAAPTLAYWHSYVAADGQAYFASCNFSNFSTSSIGPGVVPSWHETLGLGALSAKVAVFPVGHVAPWHVDPVVQMIQVLSGSVQWELSGTNQTQIFGPGDLYVEECEWWKEAVQLRKIYVSTNRWGVGLIRDPSMLFISSVLGVSNLSSIVSFLTCG